jgi:hypothetical protein
MNQIKETIDHPKIETTLLKAKMIYLPKFQNYYFVFFTFFPSSNSGASE